MKPPPLADLLSRPPAERGLSTDEAKRRLVQAGPNEPVPAQRSSVWRQLAESFANPLYAVLLIACALSAALGERGNAVLVAGMVVASGLLGFYQTYRSQQAVERLRATIAPTATVLRDNAWREIPRREVVPGDVVRLDPGAIVPADVYLLQATDLHIQESALTGESMPVEKASGVEAGVEAGSADAHEADARGRAFLGTSVVSGSGTALVTTTGPNTVFGDIAARLAIRPPETDFDRSLRELSLFISRVVVFLVLFVFAVTTALHHSTLESLLFAVALAVGLTPEFLPAITTVTLSRGAVRMARQEVIVKNLAAIQNLGSIDVLCSDKTGTLTTGTMTLSDHVDIRGRTSDRVFLLAYLNSFHATDVGHPFSTSVSIEPSLNPLEGAVRQHDHPDVSAYEKVGEIPFDFERRRSGLIVGTAAERLLIVTGAPESVLSACSGYEDADGHPVAWEDASRSQAQATYQGLSAQGYRVLAVASRKVPDQAQYRPADETDLTLAGFIVFVDPPRADAAASLQALRNDGVTVKILTGDNDLVAHHLCGQVGLDSGAAVMGPDLDRMNDEALAAVAERTTVFARVTPAQKNRILLALKRRRHVVGFLGDGINDAPSLHAADVGVSVNTATDVAKDAADIILLRPGLDTLHNGIVEGRRAFLNVQKYLLMNVSSNFGNMLSMAGASLFLPFLPMLPGQVLLNNFLYDASQVTIPMDDVDPDLARVPRRWDLSLVRDFMAYIGPVSSLFDFLTFYVLLRVFHASEALFHTGWFVESLATQTLVIFVIRTPGSPLRSRPAWPLTATVLAAVLIAAVLPYTPLARPLGFAPLPPAFLGFLVAAVATYLLLVDGVKRWFFGRRALASKKTNPAGPDLTVGTPLQARKA